jgi:hypothetical protein
MKIKKFVLLFGVYAMTLAGTIAQTAQFSGRTLYPAWKPFDPVSVDFYRDLRGLSGHAAIFESSPVLSALRQFDAEPTQAQRLAVAAMTRRLPEKFRSQLKGLTQNPVPSVLEQLIQQLDDAYTGAQKEVVQLIDDRARTLIEKFGHGDIPEHRFIQEMDELRTFLMYGDSVEVCLGRWQMAVQKMLVHNHLAKAAIERMRAHSAFFSGHGSIEDAQESDRLWMEAMSVTSEGGGAPRKISLRPVMAPGRSRPDAIIATDVLFNPPQGLILKSRDPLQSGFFLPAPDRQIIVYDLVVAALGSDQHQPVTDDQGSDLIGEVDHAVSVGEEMKDWAFGDNVLTLSRAKDGRYILSVVNTSDPLDSAEIIKQLLISHPTLQFLPAEREIVVTDYLSVGDPLSRYLRAIETISSGWRQRAFTIFLRDGVSRLVESLVQELLPSDEEFVNAVSKELSAKNKPAAQSLMELITRIKGISVTGRYDHKKRLIQKLKGYHKYPLPPKSRTFQSGSFTNRLTHPGVQVNIDARLVLEVDNQGQFYLSGQVDSGRAPYFGVGIVPWEISDQFIPQQVHVDTLAAKIIHALKNPGL